MKQRRWTLGCGGSSSGARPLSSAVFNHAGFVSRYFNGDGFYGPGTGTFMMIALVRFAKLDTRHAAGGVKVVNLASNLGSLFTALRAGYVLVGVGLISSVASILGHYIGAGLAIKNGSKIVRPTVIAVLLLLTVKVGSELLFPEFWS